MSKCVEKKILEYILKLLLNKNNIVVILTYTFIREQ